MLWAVLECLREVCFSARSASVSVTADCGADSRAVPGIVFRWLDSSRPAPIATSEIALPARPLAAWRSVAAEATAHTQTQ